MTASSCIHGYVSMGMWVWVCEYGYVSMGTWVCLPIVPIHVYIGMRVWVREYVYQLCQYMYTLVCEYGYVSMFTNRASTCIHWYASMGMWVRPPFVPVHVYMGMWVCEYAHQLCQYMYTCIHVCIQVWLSGCVNCTSQMCQLSTTLAPSMHDRVICISACM